MAFLNLITRSIDRLNGLVGAISAVLTILMVVNVFAVVALRYGLSFGRIWMQELYVWTHAAVFLAASGFTLRENGHVRIDLVYGRLGLKVRAFINLLGSIIFALPFLYFLWTWAFPLVERSFSLREASSETGGLPGFFILKGFILLFVILLALQVLALTIRSIQTMVSGKDYLNSGLKNASEY